jgi:hypothetical protein
MKHLSWKYRRKRTPKEMAEFRAAQAERVEKRWQREREKQAGEPIRKTRVVVLEVKDSARMRAVIRLEAEETERGWSRWAVSEGGERIGKRRWGRRAVGLLIAGWLE